MCLFVYLCVPRERVSVGFTPQGKGKVAMKVLGYIVCVAAMMLLTAGDALACKCAKTFAPGDTAPYAAVFAGRVAKIDERIKDRVIHFEIESVWKGDILAETPIYVGRTSCDLDFEKNTRYLVYAVNHTEDARLRTHACTRTQRIEIAAADLRALGTPAPPAAAHEDTDAARLEAWTLDKVERAPAPARPLSLSRVVLGHHRKLDRVAFLFADSREELPGYTVEYAAPPFTADGSGAVIPVEGTAFLRVRLRSAQAHTDAGKIKVLNAVRRARKPMIEELRRTSDFEGQIEYIIGLREPQRRFRVFTLTQPARLVIDIEH